MRAGPTYAWVNVADARAHLVAALARLDAMDQRKLPGGTGREQSAALAEIGKELLFVAHLCRKAEVLALDEYHYSRGFEGPGYATEAKTYSVTVTPTEEAQPDES